MLNLLNSILNKKDSSPQIYDFDLDFFLDNEHKIFFEENGYAVFENVVPQEAIDSILTAYKLLKNYKGYYDSDGFITSANYGLEIQLQVHKILCDVAKNVFPKIFDTDKIYYNLLNVLVLKFNKDKKEFFPHQDVPYVDEAKGATVLAWIPAEDINENNGSILVLPKSHKFFRWQRTHDQSHSPLKNLHAEFLKRMIPIYLKKGDLLLFDNSLLHASAPNNSENVRIAVNTGVASKKNQLIHYRLIPNQTNKIEKYNVDEMFWHTGHFITPDIVPEKYGVPETELLRRTKYYSLTEFNKTMLY